MTIITKMARRLILLHNNNTTNKMNGERGFLIALFPYLLSDWAK